MFLFGGCFLIFNNCFAKIEITEIMYNLPGADDKHEWVEIYNNSAKAIDLTGWKFNDGDTITDHILNAPPKNNSRGSLVLAIGEYALLAGDAGTLTTDLPAYQGTIIDTILDLKNSSSTLSIFDNNGNLIDNVFYNSDWGAAGNGKTLEKNIQGQWQESATDGGTPGMANNLPQTADRAQQTANGQQQTATDDRLPSTVDSPSPTDEPEYKKYSDKIYINEFIPNPVGNDPDNEWIELINLDSEIIDLSDWQISDNATSTKPFTIPEATLIQPNELLLFKRPQTKIALNNNGDTVKLFYPNADLSQEINYADSQEGWSVAREKDEDYAWTSEPTPEAINVIKQEIKKTTAPLPKKSLITPMTTATETGAQPAFNSTPNSIAVVTPDESDNDENQTLTTISPSSPDKTPTMANDQSAGNQTLPANTVNDILAQAPTNSQASPDPEQLTASINNPAESGAKNQTFAWGKTIALATLIAGFGAIILVNIRRRLH